MKLWRISQTVNDDYDTYDSAIVAAVDEDCARKTHPGGPNKDWKYRHSGWAHSWKEVTAEYLGEAREGMEAGVILASFNAG